MPVSSVEGLTSAAPTAVLNSIHAWDARSSPKATDSAPVPSTLSRHSGSGSGSSAPRPSRSPIHRTHQPYRDLPLSIFGVESELQSFAGVNTDKVVAVKPAYKAGLPHVRPASSLSLRPSQRSPITALDAGDSLTAAPAVPCGGGGGGGGAMGSAAGPVPGLSIAAGHSRPVRAGMNKRIVSLDQMERYGAGSGTVNECGNVSDMYRCSVALRLVEAEEKHLNYTGVELPAADLNLSDTAERARRLQQRRRQMQYGKETTGYANYISAVPNRWDREFRNPMHPMTPRPEYDCSKRTFDRYLNIWRRQLHLWDDYDRNNPSVQHVRIGIPTLRRLGLEVPPGTPDPYANGLRAFTPPNMAKSNSCGGNGGIASCTPVSYRFQWRDPSMSSSSYQRQQQQQQQGPYSAGVGSAGGQAAMAHHMRPSSGCGGASWSITNTPHTPYHGGNISCHGSTHSNNSYPTLLSVLAQPTIYSPHWADSSQHSSPTPNNTKCSGVYYHSGGMPANGSGGAGAAMSGMNNNNNANIAPVSIGNGGGSTEPGGGGGGGSAAYWEGNSYYNNSGYGYRTHGSPYGGRRYTPQSTPSHHYQHHYYAATAGASGAGGGYGAGGGMACAAAHGQEQ